MVSRRARARAREKSETIARFALQKRKGLRIIVSSATVDAEELRDFFNVNATKDPDKGSAVIMSVEGRLYPVEILFLKGKSMPVVAIRAINAHRPSRLCRLLNCDRVGELRCRAGGELR